MQTNAVVPLRNPTRAPSAPKRLGEYRHVAVGERELRELRTLIEYEGVTEMAVAIGVSKVTLLRVAAGFLHRCRPDVQQRIKAFFATHK